MTLQPARINEYVEGNYISRRAAWILTLEGVDRFAGVAGIRQTFTPGDALHFTLEATTQLNQADIFGQNYNDTFNLHILDSGGHAIPTLGYSTVGDVFVALALDGPKAQPLVFASDASANPSAGGSPISIPAPVINSSPEPGTALLSCAGLAILGAVLVRRRLGHQLRTSDVSPMAQ